MTIRLTPILPPDAMVAHGGCISCGRAFIDPTPAGAQEMQFVDLGANIDYEGAVFLCTSCLYEAAHLINMVSLERAEAELEKAQLASYEAIQMKEAAEADLLQAIQERAAAEKFMERVLQRAGIIERPVEVVRMAGEKAPFEVVDGPGAQPPKRVQGRRVVTE